MSSTSRLLIIPVLMLAALPGYLAWQGSLSERPPAEPEIPARERGKSQQARDTDSEEKSWKKASEDAEASPTHPVALLADMREVRDCYETPKCTLTEEPDPRAEYFAAGNRVAEGMRSLMAEHEAGGISDHELSRAALEFLGMESGRTRAAAIEALGQVPPKREHLDALFDTLDQHHDEKLFELALPGLLEHARMNHSAAVDAFLQSNLRNGGRFPGRTIARNLAPFLSGENREDYRTLLEELPADSKRAELLEQALAEDS